MAWVHDSGYGPAYDHEGSPVAIQVDGPESPSSSAPTRLEVIGWRSACDCRWRGMQFYPRSEWPSTTAAAPDGVDGWETGTGAFAEWERHLDRVLPDLAVHDLAKQLVDVEDRLARACLSARFAGLSWGTHHHSCRRPSCGALRAVRRDDRPGDADRLQGEHVPRTGHGPSPAVRLAAAGSSLGLSPRLILGATRGPGWAKVPAQHGLIVVVETQSNQAERHSAG